MHSLLSAGSRIKKLSMLKSLVKVHILLLLTLHSSWIMQLPEPFGFIFTWFAALPLILFLAQLLTKAIVQDFLILKVFVRRTIHYSLCQSIYIGVERKLMILFFSGSRGHVQIVVLRTFPSLGLYCQSLVVVQQTKWNVQSMSLYHRFVSTLLMCLFLRSIVAMFYFQLQYRAGIWLKISGDHTSRSIKCINKGTSLHSAA